MPLAESHSVLTRPLFRASEAPHAAIVANNELDRRTRKFAEVPPELMPRVQLTNRGVPPLKDLGPLKQLVGVLIGKSTGCTARAGITVRRAGLYTRTTFERKGDCHDQRT